MDSEKMIVRVGLYKPPDPIPRHDFSKFENTDLAQTIGLVAATQNQLHEQIKSRMRLEPTAKEIRYFYYEVVSGE